MSRDVDVARERLTAIAASAAFIARHLEDLHALAYERRVGEHTKVSRSGVVGVDSVGDARVRALWRRLTEDAREIETDLKSLEHGMLRFLAAGPGVEESRGSLISKREFRLALRAQANRAANGQRPSPPLIDQPNYPGTSGP